MTIALRICGSIVLLLILGFFMIGNLQLLDVVAGADMAPYKFLLLSIETAILFSIGPLALSAIWRKR